MTNHINIFYQKYLQFFFDFSLKLCFLGRPVTFSSKKKKKNNVLGEYTVRGPKNVNPKLCDYEDNFRNIIFYVSIIILVARIVKIKITKKETPKK